MPTWQAPFDLGLITKFAVPVFVILIIAEMIFVRIFRRGRYHVKDSAASLGVGLLTQVITLFTGTIVILAYDFAHQHRLFDIGWTAPALVACFFLEDLCYYCMHRVSHQCRWFWASHVVHHSSQNFNMTISVRRSWTSNLAFGYIFWLPLIFIGFPPAMVLMFSAFSLVYQFFIHTELVGRLGPLEWFMNTPSHHRPHHSVNPKYLDTNYGAVLIIWDRLFGTFIEEDESEVPQFGLVNNLGTYNPVRIALHEWIEIIRDLGSARSLRQAVGYLFGPPGWSPDGSRKTTRSIKQVWQDAQTAMVPAALPTVAKKGAQASSQVTMDAMQSGCERK